MHTAEHWHNEICEIFKVEVESSHGGWRHVTRAHCLVVVIAYSGSQLVHKAHQPAGMVKTLQNNLDAAKK